MHDRLLLRALAMLSVAALLPLASAKARAASGMDAALDAIAAYAPRAMREQGTPGLSIAITDRSNTLRIITLGYANRETQAPVTAQTTFAIGSITKSMTALALLELHDSGRLDLNAPVTRYLPWFAIESLGGPILVHELLSHTGGVPDDYAEEPGYVYDIWALRTAKTLFAPGTSWSYSNDGYATAGAVLGRIDGRSWPDALRARVLSPIGMTATSPVMTPSTMSDAAVGYQLRDNDRPESLAPALVPSPQFDFVDPAGSVLSTPEDMARYLRFYLNGGKTADGTRLISAATFAAMTSPDTLKNGKPAGSPETELAEAPAFYKRYGYGLSTFNDGGDRLIGHTGGISGYTACMQANLSRGYGVIAFANLVEAPLHPCAVVLYAMSVLRAQSLGEALPTAPAPPDPARVMRAGDYDGAYTAAMPPVRVVSRNDRLYLEGSGNEIALYPRGTDLFWADSPQFSLFLLSFGRDRQKRVVEMTYGSHWYANERYQGPRTFPYPPSWNALTGRYENTFFGQPAVTRAIVVKGRLTLDGISPLTPLRNGTFDAGGSIVRFDAFAGGHAQRLSIDDTHFYRIELP
jgi:CubicO group peptidase (beta-lactamase class C family)